MHKNIIAVLIIVLFTGCSKVEESLPQAITSGTTTFKNTEYNYTIDYPTNLGEPLVSDDFREVVFIGNEKTSLTCYIESNLNVQFENYDIRDYIDVDGHKTKLAMLGDPSHFSSLVLLVYFEKYILIVKSDFTYETSSEYSTIFSDMITSMHF